MLWVSLKPWQTSPRARGSSPCRRCMPSCCRMLPWLATFALQSTGNFPSLVLVLLRRTCSSGPCGDLCTGTAFLRAWSPLGRAPLPWTSRESEETLRTVDSPNQRRRSDLDDDFGLLDLSHWLWCGWAGLKVAYHSGHVLVTGGSSIGAGEIAAAPGERRGSGWLEGGRWCNGH